MPKKLILPYLCLLYFINYLDRVNIGFAGPNGMSEELKLSATVFGFASGVLNGFAQVFDDIARMTVGRALRTIAPSRVVPGPSGVAVRTRLKGLSAEDERVLRLVGSHLGSLAAGDLRSRCADGLAHSPQRWADRKRGLTPVSSSRWAGSVTKASHDQWALARRCQAAYVESLRAGVAMLERRLALPVGSAGSKREPGGYRSRHEWFVKSRRLVA